MREIDIFTILSPPNYKFSVCLHLVVAFISLNNFCIEIL